MYVPICWYAIMGKPPKRACALVAYSNLKGNFRTVPNQEFSIRNRPYRDLTGQVFSQLTVIKFAYRKKHIFWECLCSCGNTTYYSTGDLYRGRTVSCGCYRKNRNLKHGHARKKQISKEYTSWYDMKRRCCDPNQSKYYLYGGKGIKVCDRWLHSFENFLADMGLKPTPKHSIERLDASKDYEPINCVWATVAEQNRNKSTNRRITFNGETLCLKDWSVRLNIPYMTLSKRLTRWPLEQAMTEPIRTQYARHRLLTQPPKAD